MFALSDGVVIDPADIPKVFFSHSYRGSNFIAYNLKFDSGSLLYNLPVSALNTLRERNGVYHDGYHYKYIPHKMLRIRRGRNAVTFWDIYGFYGMSLDAAAKKHLGKSKLEVETKEFTREYVKSHYNQLAKYCVRDALLTKELGDLFLTKLHKINLYPNNLYSTASVSFQYFKQNCDIVTVWRFWNECRPLLRYGCEAYYGGKVEVTARGSFTGYEYDINSAYASEISRLVDISDAKVKRLKRYDPAAWYGYYRVYIHDLTGIHHSIVHKRKNMNIYPAGSYYATVTQAELEYLQAHNIDVKVLSGYGLYIKNIHYPYRSTVHKLQAIKEEYKDKDLFVSNIAKLCNNSFYGKMAQLIEDPDGNLIAGVGWNSLYSSVITANIRLKVVEVQNALGDACIAVHTDAVTCTEPIPDRYIGDKFGQFMLKRQGKGIMIMSGMYQLGDKSAYRGFRMGKGFSWYDKLSNMGTRSKTVLSFREAKSWISAVIQNKPEEINRFMDMTKELDLNAESKRLWLERTNAEKLLSSLEVSLPILYNEPYDRHRR